MSICEHHSGRVQDLTSLTTLAFLPVIAAMRLVGTSSRSTVSGTPPASWRLACGSVPVPASPSCSNARLVPTAGPATSPGACTAQCNVNWPLSNVASRTNYRPCSPDVPTIRNNSARQQQTHKTIFGESQWCTAHSSCGNNKKSCDQSSSSTHRVGRKACCWC